MRIIKSLNFHGCTSIDPDNMTIFLKYCKTLRALNISYCSQLNVRHISTLVESLNGIPCLEKLQAESICPFSVEIVWELLGTLKLKELDLTLTWGPPSEWVELLTHYPNVKFGKQLMLQSARSELPNYLYADD